MEYPNSGALWANKKRTTEKHPNTQGNIKIERSLLKELMDSSNSELVEIALSGWTRDYNGERMISLKASKPYKPQQQKQSAPADEDESDVPF